MKNVENISVTDEIQKTHKWCTALNSNCPKEQSESEVDDVLNTSDQNEKDLGNISAEIESLNGDTDMLFKDTEMDDEIAVHENTEKVWIFSMQNAS